MELITWNKKMILLHGDKLTKTQKAIGLRSNGLHVEWRFSDRYGRISWSCTLADGCGCCRFKMINYSHPYRQSRVRVPVTAEQEALLFKEACRMAGLSVEQAISWIKNPKGGWKVGNHTTIFPAKECYYGPNAIKYDKYGASFSFITKWQIWKMHEADMICNEACANLGLKVWPDLLIASHVPAYDAKDDRPAKKYDPAKLTPDQFEYMVRHYFTKEL